MIKLRDLALSALLAAPLLLLGCAGGKPTPKDHFYRLGEPTQGKGSPAAATSISLRPFITDGLRQDRAMLYSEDPEGLVLVRFNYHFWVKPPPDLVRDYLVRYLRANGAAGTIIRDTSGVRTGMSLGGNLLRFEQVRVAGQPVKAIVELELILRDKNGKVVLQKTYQATVATDGDRMASVVKGFASALDEIAAQFLSDMNR